MSQIHEGLGSYDIPLRHDDVRYCQVDLNCPFPMARGCESGGCAQHELEMWLEELRDKPFDIEVQAEVANWRGIVERDGR